MQSQSYNGTNPPPLVQGYDLGTPGMLDFSADSIT